MSMPVEAEGRTVEEATARAAEQLSCPPEDLEVEVLDAGRGGLFGVFGHRNARVRARRRAGIAEELVVVLQQFFGALGIDVQPTFSEGDDQLSVDVDGDFDWFTRRRGHALEALQFLLKTAAGRKLHKHLVLDVGGYWVQRTAAVTKLAEQVCAQVLASGEAAVLEFMPASERRIAHMVVQNHPELASESEGVEPRRQVRIRRRTS